MAKADKSAPIGRKKVAEERHPDLKRSERGVGSEEPREDGSPEDDESPSLPSKERIAEVLR